MPYQTATVDENIEISPGVFSMLVPCADRAEAGQFYMLRKPRASVLLPRPISVCDLKGGRLRFLYQVVGRGTEELAALRPGDELCLTGPLGNGFPVGQASGKIALVGGGIGVAPMLYTARCLRELGVAVDCIMGYRDSVFLTEELGRAAGRLLIATESGAHGHKGLVTALLEPRRYTAVYACGPTPMLRAVTALCQKAGTAVYVSLENKMACGLGACLVCACADRQGKNRRVCKDGPVFRGEDLDLDA